MEQRQVYTFAHWTAWILQLVLALHVLSVFLLGSRSFMLHRVGLAANARICLLVEHEEACGPGHAVPDSQLAHFSSRKDCLQRYLVT